ncbi:DUF2207 domain-containing protein [Actinopolymorpha singaporensis]|uniref:Predicted membrane protein n=1 Tax=Actinopolymorpha singaporensis TaxID=117157 RepID=A0A1H1QR64_9ACTN|nr:DUF2207 domain-containing protein [Actinopolymorpha singaporensis]SDS25961.1 Predicted membrane protein [Actinopolymorpha singaporensis]
MTTAYGGRTRFPVVLLLAPLLAGLVLTGLGLAHPAPARAAVTKAAKAAEGDRIPAYDISARVGTDGSVAVRERFTYDLAARPTPLNWAVPIRFTSAGESADGRDQATGQVVSVHDLAVRMDGRPVRTYHDHQAWWYTIWIGPDGTTPAGRHSYEVSYVLRGLVTSPSDQLRGTNGPRSAGMWWNAVSAHDEPIDRVRLTVTAPEAPVRVSCTITDDTAPCRAGVSGSTVTFTAAGLPGRSAVTTYAELPGVHADDYTAILPGVKATLRSNLAGPGAMAGLPAGAVWGVTALLAAAVVVGLVLVARRPRLPRMAVRDTGALVTVAGLVLAYFLARYDLVWWALPVVCFGAALVVISPMLPSSGAHRPAGAAPAPCGPKPVAPTR